MIISIKSDDKYVLTMLRAYPYKASRAAEIALDKTAKLIKEAVKKEIKQVFDNPVAYTLSSLQLTTTRNHNMQAEVWFKDPIRMRKHYLVPQVEGGPRELKGFERALGIDEYIPGKGVALLPSGNVSTGIIRQMLSVLGMAEKYAGSTQNISRKSATRNKKSRDYVVIRHAFGKMPPGIYQRFTNGKELSGKQRRSLNKDIRSGKRKIGEYQAGRKGPVTARGLKPIFVKGRTGHMVRPLLPFYDIAERIYSARFRIIFLEELNRLTR